MNILNISTIISDKLGIDNQILEKILKEKLTEEQLQAQFKDDEKIKKITALLETDSKILEFGESQIKKESTKDNFNKLKNSLGKLQILVLINDLKKSKDCDDVLNSFMKVFNDKLETVNTILSDNLTQTGGNNNYIKKYLKYKIKYLKMNIGFLI
jgi:hypothetical protein